MFGKKPGCCLCLVAAFALHLSDFVHLLPAHGSTLAPAWRQQSSGVLARLNAIHFLDRRYGWAAGNNGALLMTEDGGEKWRRVALPEYERQEPVLDVWLFDAERGALLGEYDLFNRRPEIEPGKRSFLLRSENHGTNWTASEFASPPPKPVDRRVGKEKDDAPPEVSPDPVLLRMTFATARVGWTCGELGAIQKTEDGGAKWKMQFASTFRIFYDIAAVDEKQAWIVGASGVVLHTSDGGLNWNEQRSETTQTLRAVHFVDANRGWAAGSNGAILATINGGGSWQRQNSETAVTLNDIFFVNAQEGWAAGERGTLLHTTDGGASWNAESLKMHGALMRLFFIAPDCGWAVGANGAIFRYGLNEPAERPTLKQDQYREQE